MGSREEEERKKKVQQTFLSWHFKSIAERFHSWHENVA